MGDEVSRGAKCVATKRNNRVRRALPLFNDDVLRGMNLLTTPEEQQVRLERLHVSGDRYVAELLQQEQIRADTAPILRAWAKAIMPSDLIERCVSLINACPAWYEWGIWQEGIADYLGISRLDCWQSLAKFCGLKGL